MTNEKALQLRIGQRVLFRHGKTEDGNDILWKGKVLAVRSELVGNQKHVRLKISYHSFSDKEKGIKTQSKNKGNGICYMVDPKDIECI